MSWRTESTPLCRLRVGTIEYRFFDVRGPRPTCGRLLGPGKLRGLLAMHASRPEIRAMLRELATERPEQLRNHNWLRRGRPSEQILRRICCCEVEREVPAVSAVVPSEPERSPPPAFEPNSMFDDQGSWFELRLIGEDDEPLAGERCEITLPDGKIIARRTNRHGIVRVDGISTAGNCDVCFPGLDEDAWEPG